MQNKGQDIRLRQGAGFIFLFCGCFAVPLFGLVNVLRQFFINLLFGALGKINHLIMKRLSPNVEEQIKQMLPGLRQKVKEEFEKWHKFSPRDGFYSDEKVIRIVPLAAYQQLLMKKGIYADDRFIIECLNEGIMDLEKVTLSALRSIMLVDYYYMLEAKAS